MSAPSALTRRGHLFVLLGFAGLVSLYTWPLATDPAHLLPNNHDPRLYSWVMPTIFRNLVTRPALLYQGNAFYPMGNSLTFAESLLTPALIGGPLFFLTGNAVLAYNLTLLLVWTLSGWAMYAATFWVTRHHPAAFIAALAFTLSPMRIEYFVEFQIEAMFGIPLTIYALVRFFESQRWRHLMAALGVFWAQAVAVQYYTVILGLGLAMVSLQCLALRWPLWRARTFVAAATGATVLAAGLAPTLLAYALTRWEIGFERSLEDAAHRGADVLTYLEPRPNRLYHLAPRGLSAETTLLVGFGALALALVGLLWLRRPSDLRNRPERFLMAAIWACLGLGLWILVMHRPIRIGSLPGLSLSGVGVMLLVLILARSAAEGWRRRAAAWPLTERDWAGILLGLAAWAFLLSLGPVERVAGTVLGPGLYGWLYPVLLPLHAVRFITRFGILVAFVVAFMAGLGVKWLVDRLPAWTRGPVLVAVTLVLLLEYASFPLAYGPMSVTARPVDLAIKADPDDVVVLEWPTNVPDSDAEAMFWSLAHGKYVVNGFAGFEHDWLRELSGLLTPSDAAFPTPAALAALQRIYPLRYLVVRLADPAVSDTARRAWLALRYASPPALRFRGTFENEDLYELLPMPESGVHVERWVSYTFLRAHPVIHATMRPLTVSPDLDQWVDVSLNGRPIERVPLAPTTSLTATLSQGFSRVAPNVIGWRHGYRWRPAALRDARYWIGTTGVRCPGDLVVASSGDPGRRVGSIRFNDAELAPDRRGYNLVALDPTGQVVASAVFDTFGSKRASGNLAVWIDALPPGTIVAGAVRDEGSGSLTEIAVRALQTLGVGGDLRGRFREAHAFVGVKGAPLGSAFEKLGSPSAELHLGRPSERRGVTLTAFSLTRPTEAR